MKRCLRYSYFREKSLEFLSLLAQVFHCVHFECPASTESIDCRDASSSSGAWAGAAALSSPSSSSSSDESDSEETGASNLEATGEPVSANLSQPITEGENGRYVAAAASSGAFSTRSSPASFAGISSSQTPADSSANSLAMALGHSGRQQWPATGPVFVLGREPELPGQVMVSPPHSQMGVQYSHHHRNDHHSNPPSPSRMVAAFVEDHFHLPQLPQPQQQQLPEQHQELGAVCRRHPHQQRSRRKSDNDDSNE